MRDFRLRRDLQRSVVDGFELPLGIEPRRLQAPTQGYTVTYNPAEEDEPDTYTFQIVVSHSRLVPIVERAFDFLPDEVTPIVEIGSRDAYRSMDVFLAREPITVSEFLEVWAGFKDILIEDASIGVGANSEDPFVEIFLDSWKTLSIHVPTDLRNDVEAMLQSFGLEEVPETWPSPDEEPNDFDPPTQIREVLEIVDEHSPDIDELLLQLRQMWDLELNIDPDANVDESGRRLGMTLWHAYVLVESADGDEGRGAYVSIWATASNMSDMERMIHESLGEYPQWVFAEVYSLDRVAYDERPNELADLPPRRNKAQVHLVQVDEWGDGPPQPDRPSARPESPDRG
jgi:hypothetical protein